MIERSNEDEGKMKSQQIENIKHDTMNFTLHEEMNKLVILQADGLESEGMKNLP